MYVSQNFKLSSIGGLWFQEKVYVYSSVEVYWANRVLLPPEVKSSAAARGERECTRAVMRTKRAGV